MTNTICDGFPCVILVLLVVFITLSLLLSEDLAYKIAVTSLRASRHSLALLSSLPFILALIIQTFTHALT